jgi:Ca-activated chloride channel family protein
MQGGKTDMNKLLSWMLILCLIFGGGCSLFAKEEKEVSGEPEEKEVKQAATDIEGMLKEGPGKYAGNKYDEEKVKAELDKLPTGLTADEAYNHLVALLAENYEREVEMLDSVDPTIKTNLATPGAAKAAEGESAFPKQINVEILLDASGSMAGRVPGGVKMDLAKDAIRSFVSKLPAGAQVALRVYGHKGSNRKEDKDLSCQSTELVYEPGTYDEKSFRKSLSRFKPTGWTPLAAAIEQAKTDLSGNTGENVENIVYVVSDGIETCGGDPVKAAKDLHESDIQAVVNIIGFDVDNEGQRALKKVAEAGGGKYATVNTGEDLREHLEEEYRSLREAWEMWRIDSSLEADRQWGDKWDVVNEAESSMLDKTLREDSRMLDARMYLDESGKMSREEYNSLREKVYHRINQLRNYRRERCSRLYDLLRENREKERQRVRNKADEMKKKYELD